MRKIYLFLTLYFILLGIPDGFGQTAVKLKYLNAYFVSSNIILNDGNTPTKLTLRIINNSGTDYMLVAGSTIFQIDFSYNLAEQSDINSVVWNSTSSSSKTPLTIQKTGFKWLITFDKNELLNSGKYIDIDITLKTSLPQGDAFLYLQDNTTKDKYQLIIHKGPLVYDKSNKVGINKGNPTRTLDVKGDAYFDKLSIGEDEDSAKNILDYKLEVAGDLRVTGNIDLNVMNKGTNPPTSMDGWRLSSFNSQPNPGNKIIGFQYLTISSPYTSSPIFFKVSGGQHGDRYSALIQLNGKFQEAYKSVKTPDPITGRDFTIKYADLVPKGVIVMWNGTTAPAGWAICDGTNGTPNLSGRFIVGYNNASATNKLTGYNVGEKGGSETVALTTAEMPGHNHDAGSLVTGQAGQHAHSMNGSATIDNDGDRFRRSQSDGYTKSLSTSTNGNHNHPISGRTANAGKGQAHENRPPYYTLAYIMKL